MDRREFFRLGAQKTAKVAVDTAEKHVNHKASRWIRPPFAISELDFITSCTRCDECISACPHQVIFPLPVRVGIEVAATPAMDLLNKGCHLCEGWPCVTACEPNALMIPEALVVAIEDDEAVVTEDDLELATALTIPRLAEAEIDQQQCLPYSGPECGACRGSCPIEGALVWQDEKPMIDADLCVGCAMCREACITEPKAVTVRSNYS